MCQTSVIVTAILILVISLPCRRASQTFGGPRPRTNHPRPTTNADYTLASPLLLHLDDVGTYSLSNAESTEEQQGYTYNSYYAPSTVNFHDIYSNSLAMLAEEPVLTTQKDEDSFHLNNIPTQFVEFHPHTQTVPTVTEPPPRFLKSSMLKNDTDANATTTTTSTTTEEPEEISIRVIPIRKDYQRGVLDLLFPAARVKTFKKIWGSSGADIPS
ncbi:uncharacterized protein LOC113500139 isoform X2 [Trichoplusia ni]|uniref:Uncharacterized protein LOC113500139 isoform X2 n=1 Tax=Trichoplusia ni TaxID=7111 RepID=A0A7E5W7J1_TRINI|nr:uncharacterized protein LOC113500139 isoform X2 [Trichoplusia ni]